MKRRTCYLCKAPTKLGQLSQTTANGEVVAICSACTAKVRKRTRCWGPANTLIRQKPEHGGPLG